MCRRARLSLNDSTFYQALVHASDKNPQKMQKTQDEIAKIQHTKTICTKKNNNDDDDDDDDEKYIRCVMQSAGAPKQPASLLKLTAKQEKIHKQHQK